MAAAIILVFASVAAFAVSKPCESGILEQRPGKLLLSLMRTRDEHWLAHGQGCYKGEETSNCEWETTLKLDAIVGNGQRILIYTGDHLAGSGAWDAVRVYGCLGGSPHILFSKSYHYGAKVSSASPDEIVITSGDWQSHDPSCCPSKEKQEHYVWSASKGRYLLKRTSTSAVERR